MTKSVFKDVREDVEKEMKTVREGVRISRERKALTMTGVERIAAERQRQIEVEGWTPEHDDEHNNRELAKAAACYAVGTDRFKSIGGEVVAVWPWEDRWWKPSDDPIRNLEKAGALIAAEIDRLQRKQTLDNELNELQKAGHFG